VPFKNNLIIELSNPNYVPVIKDTDTFYGGSQMWFPTNHRYSKDYILHSYGCGTIATADMFLYLALQNVTLQSPETEIALRGATEVSYDNYDPYVRIINDNYTKTRRIIAVLGPTIASAINKYSSSYNFGYQAIWKWSLTYYDMYDIIEEMLYQKEELLSNKAKYINPKTIKSNRRRCLKKDKQNRKNAWNCDRGSDGKSSRFSYHKRRSNEMVRRTAFVIMNGNGYRKEYDYANEIN